jgi:hypothetical protein
MLLTCQTLLLSDINNSTEWCLHPWNLARLPGKTQHSFAGTGILHPPIVVPEGEGKYTVLTGHRRIFYARIIAQVEQILCLVASRATAPRQLLEIVLTDQLSTGGLSLAEKATFLTIAGRMVSDSEIIDTYLGRLCLNQRPASLHQARQILRLAPLLILAIDEGFLQQKMVEEFLGLKSDSDRLALLGLFRDLAMGDGKQRRFFTLVRDIAGRRGESIAAYLDHEQISAIRHSSVLNIAQKIQHLGDYLQREYSPLLSSAEKEFHRQTTTLQLPPGHVLAHSPSFEKDEVTLAITFENFAACAAYLKER